MRILHSNFVAGIAAAAAMIVGAAAADAADATPKRGGILKFVVPASDPPSADGHRETTFATIHPYAQFYSTLIRVNPDNPASPTDIVCDLCVDTWKVSDDGKKYTFKIRDNVKFHDGSKLTSQDVKATFDRIVNPPEGVSSARKAYFIMVDKITAPDDTTLVFDLKYPSGAFIPAVAAPYNFVYSKAKLAADQHWYEKNVMGSGPFRFVEYQAGAFIKAERNPDYYVKGLPYLDGTEAIFASQESVNIQAIRGNRAHIQFRGFPPAARDDLVKALGDQITVQESDWNCMLLITANQEVKPFDDPRVRRALTLAVDRWGGSQYLSRIAIVKTVGGMVYPGHPLAATKEELEKIAGYWPDLEKSRAEAKRLLKEAGAEGISFELHNRAVDQPYKIVGTWLIDQWSKIGLKVTQRVQQTTPFYDTLRTKRDFQVSLDFNCQSIVNPLLDVQKWTSNDFTSDQYGGYQDRQMDKWFEAMNESNDPAEQRRIMREYEKRGLDEMGHTFVTLWWYRIMPHRSVVKNWKINPSHYLNLDFASVWLDE